MWIDTQLFLHYMFRLHHSYRYDPHCTYNKSLRSKLLPNVNNSRMESN